MWSLETCHWTPVFTLSKWICYILFSPLDTEERNLQLSHAPLKCQTPAVSFGSLSLMLFFGFFLHLCQLWVLCPTEEQKPKDREQRETPSRTLALPALCLLPWCMLLSLPGKVSKGRTLPPPCLVQPNGGYGKNLGKHSKILSLKQVFIPTHFTGTRLLFFCFWSHSAAVYLVCNSLLKLCDERSSQNFV